MVNQIRRSIYGHNEAIQRRQAEKTVAELTEAEWEIMRVVWDKEPCAAGTVQETLAATRDWCYATVKLTMDRMVAKGFLEINKIRNLQLFRPCISEVEARRGSCARSRAGLRRGPDPHAQVPDSA